MEVFGIGPWQIFFHLAALLLAAFLIVATWEEKEIDQKGKQLLSALVLVGLFGVSVAIHQLAHAEIGDNCKAIPRTITVEGRDYAVPADGWLKMCQDPKSGRFYIRGPNGEVKGLQ